MHPKLVIFDFDGVIVNTEDVFFYKLYDILKNFGINMSFQETYKMFSGNDTYTVLGKVIKKYNPSLNVKEVFNCLTKCSSTLLNNIVKTPHVDELLSKLNIPFCIASNSDKKHIVNVLNHIQLNNFFTESTIFSAHDFGRFKPHPDVYLAALKYMGYSAEEALAIEDSIPGLTAARKANIPTIAFAGSAYVDFKEHAALMKELGALTTVNSFKEVINILTWKEALC